MSEAHAALERILRDSTRAGEVIRRIRTLAKKTDMKMAPLNLNDLLSEAVTFAQHELLSSGVTLRTEYASALPVVLADKVQLQQVILNLVINGIEAMHPITDRPRELLIRSEQDEAQQAASHGQGLRGGLLRGQRRSAIQYILHHQIPAAWGWDFQSAVRSSNFTGDASGQCPICLTAPYFSSPCLCLRRRRREYHSWYGIMDFDHHRAWGSHRS